MSKGSTAMLLYQHIMYIVKYVYVCFDIQINYSPQRVFICVNFKTKAIKRELFQLLNIHYITVMIHIFYGKQNELNHVPQLKPK